jgi:hypothetical protein
MVTSIAVFANFAPGRSLKADSYLAHQDATILYIKRTTYSTNFFLMSVLSSHVSSIQVLSSLNRLLLFIMRSGEHTDF